MERAQGRHGLFIVLEGPDGAGKSVQAQSLATRLRERGHDVVATREPGGTSLGEQVRHIVNDPGPTPRGPKADVLLYSAARAQHVDEVIRPALEAGRTVVCDRYVASTMAYQGYGSGMDHDLLERIARWVTAGLEPDLVLLLDLSPRLGLERRATGAELELTRWEDAARFDLGFHTRVREGYLEMAAANPDRWAVIDGSGAVDAVAAAVDQAVERRLARR
jgi:dTMP kinase